MIPEQGTESVYQGANRGRHPDKSEPVVGRVPCQRNGLTMVIPSTSRPWLMSSEYTSRQPSTRAAAMIALSQYEKPWAALISNAPVRIESVIS